MPLSATLDWIVCRFPPRPTTGESQTVDLDLMEEYRPVFADRLVLTMLGRRQLQRDHCDDLPGGAVRLAEGGRRIVLTEWQRSKQRERPHPCSGATMTA